MKIIFTLLHHQWLSFWRSRGSGKSFALQIVLGFFIFYIIAVAIVLGVQMPAIIARAFPKKNVTDVFCGFILYYYFIDAILRCRNCPPCPLKRI